mgnify:FL=1
MSDGRVPILSIVPVLLTSAGDLADDEKDVPTFPVAGIACAGKLTRAESRRFRFMHWIAGMEIFTTRFGQVTIDAEDILLFPNGLLGYEDHQHWVLLADADNPAVGWLQSVTRPGLAMAAVSPRRFVPGYHLRVDRAELSGLQLGKEDKAYVLTLISSHEGQLTTNLRAPVVINLQRRLGRQVVTSDEQPLRHVLAPAPVPLRKSA